MIGTTVTKQTSTKVTKSGSSNKKGIQSEKKTENLLMEHGIIVHSVQRPSYRGKSHDIYGLFDHIAQIPGHPPAYIQTKTNKYVSIEKSKRDKMNSLNYKLQFVFLWFDEGMKIMHLQHGDKFVKVSIDEMVWAIKNTYKDMLDNNILLFN